MSKHKSWTEDEDEVLRTMWTNEYGRKHKQKLKIAEALGRSVSGVNLRACRLRLTTPPRNYNRRPRREYLLADGRQLMIDRTTITYILASQENPTERTVLGIKDAPAVVVAAPYEKLADWWRPYQRPPHRSQHEAGREEQAA